MRSLLALAVLFAGIGSGQVRAQSVDFSGDSQGFEEIARPFFSRYCKECHGPREQNADLRVDLLAAKDFASPARSERWGEILDMVNGYQMPPEDELQPKPEESGEFSDWLLGQLAAGERARRNNDFVLRRLNRSEYNNTIRDLIGVPFLPANDFPEDGSASGFDNNGSALTISPLHLELYYEAARNIVDRAIVSDENAPRQISWRFEPEENTRGLDRLRVNRDGQNILVNSGKNTRQGEWTRVRSENWDTPIGVRDFRLPYPGEYIIRFRAYGQSPDRSDVVASVERIAGARASRVLDHFRTDRMYEYGPPRVRISQRLAGQPGFVTEMDVSASQAQPETYEIKAFFSSETAGISFEYAYDIPRSIENLAIQRDDQFARPEFAIDWIEIEGPIVTQWPPSSHTALLPDDSLDDSHPPAYVRDALSQFMTRAYRRPVKDTELNAMFALYENARANGQSLYEAIKAPFTAILVSPHFLFMVETTGAQDSENSKSFISDYELATRLSYFLWSSMPDDALFSLAANGELSNSESLLAQVDRMLVDPKSQSFIENFAGQWIGLREVGANPPVETLFPRYNRHLEESIVRESEAFFAEILHNDLDIRNFIRSDFVTVNERLARFYGIPGVKGDEIQRVDLMPGTHRGGLVTQASVLSITSNGTRTSPVSRGVWVLRAMLGQDPGLPVTNVGEIAPNVPGLDKATVRDRLELHRSLPQCARCHNRIDPLGLALENYDASGSWRDQEGFGYNGLIRPDDPRIDASARLPDGRIINGVSGLQQALLDQDTVFFTALTEKLLAYALGRSLGYSDVETVRQIVANLDPNRPTLRSLIYSIVTAEEFRTR